MNNASTNLDFEKAANIRDKIFAVQKVTEKQKIITGNFEDEDFINISSDEVDSCVQIVFLKRWQNSWKGALYYSKYCGFS